MKRRRPRFHHPGYLCLAVMLAILIRFLAGCVGGGEAGQQTSYEYVMNNPPPPGFVRLNCSILKVAPLATLKAPLDGYVVDVEGGAVSVANPPPSSMVARDGGLVVRPDAEGMAAAYVRRDAVVKLRLLSLPGDELLVARDA